MADVDITKHVMLALRNINRFASGLGSGGIENFQSRFGMNETWHWFKHCFGPSADTKGVMTTDGYFRLGQELGRMAANGALGTHFHCRLNDEILVYWERRSAPGLFMVVRPYKDGGELVSLFSPDDGKAYYDAACTEPGPMTKH